MDQLHELAAESYKYFASLEGNQHIASEYALERALKLARRWNVRDVLELGLGIGSIAYTIRAAADRQLFRRTVRYAGTENNAFCLEQLARNLGPSNPVDIYPDLDHVPRGRRFDLIIVDGRDTGLGRITELMHPNAIIFVEGDRSDQVAALRALHKGSLAYRDISVRQNPAYGPFSSELWAGGCQVVFARPTIRQRIEWLLKRLETALKYRVVRPLIKSRAGGLKRVFG